MINLKLMILFNKYSDKVLFRFHFQIYFYIYSLSIFKSINVNCTMYRSADKSLARPGRKEATATEDFDFHISYLQS
jgi:hypothetical protein